MTATSHSHVAEFIGRATLLEMTRATLLDDRHVAIVGVGGVGKTAMALAYMRRFTKDYQHVLWLNASSREALLADCVGWSQHLKLPMFSDYPLPLMVQPLRDWLAKQRDYLLVVDGADDPTLLTTIFPTPLTGHVLATTRAQLTPPDMQSLRLDGLSERDGALLILRRARIVGATDEPETAGTAHLQPAITLTRMMGGLPLALELAGATMKATQQSVQDYLRDFQGFGDSSVTNQAHRISSNQAITTTCALISAHLKRQRPAAIAVLQTSALLAPDLLYRSMLSALTKPTATKQERELTDLDTLIEMRLLNRQQSSQLLRMHPQVQETLRAQMTLDEQRQCLDDVMLALHGQLPTYAPATIATCLRYAANIKAIASHSDQWTFRFTEAAEVLSWAAMVLGEQEALRDAIALQRTALVIWERSTPPDQAAMAQALHNLATLYEQAGDAGEAEQCLHRAVQMRAAALGAEHPDTINSLGSLGYMYYEQDNFIETEAIYHKTLALCERKLGLADPVPKLIQYHLAMLCLDLNRFAEAETLLHQIHDFYVKTRGAKHPKVAEVMYKLGIASLFQQHEKQAESYLRQAIAIYESDVAQHAIEIIECHHQLMLFYAAQNNKPQVESALKRIIALREAQAREPCSPKTVLNVVGLAGIYFGAERFAEAETLLQQAIAMIARMPELGAPYMAMMLNTLASTYHATWATRHSNHDFTSGVSYVGKSAWLAKARDR